MAALALVMLMSVLTSSARSSPTVLWDDIDLGGLTEIRSANGILDATLTAAPAPVHVGDTVFYGSVYNGDYAGPVLHVRPGDLVRLRLVNHLSFATNLHFHGLRVSPLNHGDNMHIVVQPGATSSYTFRIPADHPPGLFWYHDHMHPDAERHVMDGLSGAILVDGFARQFQGLNGIRQKLLVIKDNAPADCTGQTMKTLLHCRVISINGQALWNDMLRPKETQLWRIVNQSPDFTMHLDVTGLHPRTIGRDGTPTLAMEESDLDIMPASRLDVLVTAGALGSLSMIARHVPTGSGAAFSTNRIVGNITIAGDASVTQPEKLIFPRQSDLSGSPISAQRTMVFTEDEAANRYYINGRMFDHDRIDVRVPLGSIESWTIQNQTQNFHEFHIHQIGFQVAEINGQKQPFAGYVDDVRVPEMGEVKLIMPFTDPVILGRFMFHCHVLKHEDAGMMGNIEIYRPGYPMTAPICLFPGPASGSPLP